MALDLLWYQISGLRFLWPEPCTASNFLGLRVPKIKVNAFEEPSLHFREASYVRYIGTIYNYVNERIRQTLLVEVLDRRF